MTSQSPLTDNSRVMIADYDEDNYDYRSFWTGRDYENWAETQVLRRLLQRTTRAEWLVDLGGGFGRHIPLYKAHADHVVLVDYSMTNLTNAQHALLPGKDDGKLYLIRANIYHLPFRDGAFDLGMTTRVIHHLKAIDAALAEMGRALSTRWMLDVPIKTHLLARARGLAHGQLFLGRDRHPHQVGTAETPFFNFHLGAVRERLAELGWTSEVLASVNNFRRWESAVPDPVRGAVRPLVNAMEMALQRIGRGWWGPAQFLWLTRKTPVTCTPAALATLPSGPIAELAPRMQCPACRGELSWSADEAYCAACHRIYGHTGPIWDFVVA
jgi:SAM-dependent methyltransferase